MKKVIFCADGTWSHPKSTTTVSESDTNVYKLYKALPTTATQCPRYDDGVGVGGSFLSSSSAVRSGKACLRRSRKVTPRSHMTTWREMKSSCLVSAAELIPREVLPEC